MLQDAVQQEEWPQPDVEPEGLEYVPNIRCPVCGNEIRLDKEAYAFYKGVERCDRCLAGILLVIGDLAHAPLRGNYLSHVPVVGALGGKLLEAPVVAEPPAGVPPSFLQVVNSERIAGEARRHMMTASRHYVNRAWRSAMIACRSAVQMALLDLQVKDGPVGAMIDQAHEQGVIDGFTQHACRMIANAGGAAAHSQESPDGQREALTIIGTAVTVLGRMYALPG